MLLQVKEEMQKFHFEGLQREQKHHSLLKDTQEKLKRTESQAESYENQAGILCKILDEIKAGSVRFFLIFFKCYNLLCEGFK